MQKIANGIAIPFLSAINGIEFAFASCYTPRQLLISHLHERPFQGKTSQFLFYYNTVSSFMHRFPVIFQLVYYFHKNSWNCVCIRFTHSKTSFILARKLPEINSWKIIHETKIPSFWRILLTEKIRETLFKFNSKTKLFILTNFTLWKNSWK